MFSSSPSSSTGSPRLTRSHPVGPPPRTYAKRRTTHAPLNNHLSDTDSDAEEVSRKRLDGKKETVKSRQDTKATSQSSPSLGSSIRNHSTVLRSGSRSSSRLSRPGPRTEEITLTTRSPGASKTDEVDEEECVTAVFSQEAQDEEEQRISSSGDSRKRGKLSVATSSPLTSASATPTPTPTPRKRKAEAPENSTPSQRSVRPTRSRSGTSLDRATLGKSPTPRRRDVTPPRSVPIAGPSTPKSSPRDYAHLYAAISPDPSIMSSPSRKRPLGYSQSSGAVLESPSKLRTAYSHVYSSPGRSGPSTPSKTLARTHSMPVSPSKAVLQEDDPSALWVKPVEPEGQGSGGRAKRIYGRTRTVVAEDDDTVTNVEKLEEALSKESYASLRSRYEVNSGQATLSQEELSALVIARAPQSANDMRSKGENRRFMDETGYLLDGIEDETATKGFRRASCVDILGNMQDEDWMSKLNVCGQTERVWAAFQGVRGDGDDVMDAVCLLALYIIMNGVAGVDGVLRADAQGCVRFVTSLLKERTGMLDEKWTGKVTPMVERVRGVGESIQGDSCRTSTRTLASTILSFLSKEGFGELLTPILRSEKVLGRTLKAILPEISMLSERPDLVENGLAFVPQDDSVNLDHIRSALSIIDYMITSSLEDRHDLAQHHTGVPQAVLQALVALVSSTLDDSTQPAASKAAKGVLSCLRIFANMSNISPDWSRQIPLTEGVVTALARVIMYRETISSSIGSASDQSVGITEGTEAGELLCLVLAIVTSAVLVDERVGLVLASLALDGNCRGQASCLRSCKCSTAVPFVNELARLYASFRGDSTDGETEVVAAYLALLLSRVITAVPSTFMSINHLLPGDDTQLKLGKLITSLRALDGYRSILQRKLNEETGIEGVEWQEDGNEVKKAIDDMLKLVDTY